ncbi:MAG: DNA lyase [Thermoplasmata archaeon]|nr:MAG: DNA lyase [Thermoplasmata archaeon]HDN95941.1 N-glycosylase/DNA lyase [Thermoplasmatales archaeon]
MDEERVKEIKNIYGSIKNKIEERLEEFEKLWKNGREEDILAELFFCLLTPQSKAKACWDAILAIKNKSLLLDGSKEEIVSMLRGVRFKNKKAEYIVDARKIFTNEGKVKIRSVFEKFKDAYEAREWLVKNIKGMGYKEASHFLRNIGKGKNVAILDRHILKNLYLLEIINEIPSSISGKKYIEIENKMREFAKKINIPLAHLDLVLWYKETGEVFK